MWRRGTVPIWWFVELRSGGVGEATINVNARNPYKGTRRCSHLNPFACQWTMQIQYYTLMQLLACKYC